MAGFVTIHINAPAVAIGWHATERGAKSSVAAMNRNAGYTAYKVITDDERREADRMITVYNLVTGLPVQIRLSDRGTCVDPSTHRYHEM